MPIPRAPLFRGGPDVSRLCLGTMMFGDATPEDEAVRIIDRFLEAGGDFVDTADTYAGSRTEAILGRRLGADRDRVLLATKFGNPVAGVEGSGGLSPEWIARAVPMSLERLRTDRVDLLYIHRDDHRTPLEETMGAVAEHIAAGRVRHWAISNLRAWKIVEAVRLADAHDMPRPVVVQPYYHMLNRVPEADTIPVCCNFGMGVVPYSPIARGILTGKYRGGAPEGSRGARGDKRIREAELFPEALELAGRAADWAEGRGKSPAALAVRWALANAAVPSVIVGPRTDEQMASYIEGLSVAYDAEDEAALSALCEPGALPVPGVFPPIDPEMGRPLGALDG